MTTPRDAARNARELFDFCRAVLRVLWDLGVLARAVTGGNLIARPVRDAPVTAPRARRTVRRHPFRTAVRCMAPPARRDRSDGQMYP